MPDELQEQLQALARNDCYRVESVLKSGSLETTQLVYFVGRNGAEQGPFVRKYLDPDLGGAYERIMAAQRAGERFSHLPRVMDCYQVGERRAVVLEYAEGETLADVVYRCDPSVALACDVLPRLCDAVSELHERFTPPIIHRDLKPSNIILTAQNLTIIDLGIARTYQASAAEDTRHFGTRAYAPPEQFGFGQTDVRSDVYALGMLLYFCLTEHTPDAAARRDGFRAKGVPEPLRLVIARATAIDPAGRYATVRALRDAIVRAGTACGVPAPARATVVSDNGNHSARKPSSSVRDDEPGSSSGSAADSSRAATGDVGVSKRGKVSAIGIVWDIVLATCAVFTAAVCVHVTLYPSTDRLQQLPFAVRAMAYAGTWLVVAGGLAALCDRRPIARFVPWLRGRPLWQSFVASIAVALCGAVIAVVAMAFAPQA